MDTQDSTPSPSDAGTPTSWWQRALPATLAVIVVIAVAAVLLPGFRHQLAMSFTRQSVSYVELYFSRSTSAGARAVCVRKGRSVRVRFVIESHLARRRTIAYRVVVDPATKGLRTRRQTGSTEAVPGQSAEVTESFTLPRGEAYVLGVKLPSLDEELRVRCAARRS